MRAHSETDAEGRLDLLAKIIRPKTLGDMTQPAVLHRLQTKLLEGVESRYDPPRPRASAEE